MRAGYKITPLGQIPENWEAVTFEELIRRGIISKIQDGNHGESHPISSDFVDEGIPFIMANCITRENKLNLSNAKRISVEQYKSLRIGFAKVGDVLLTHKGTIGLTALVDEEHGDLMLTPQVTYYRVAKPTMLYNKFLYYYFQSSPFQNAIDKFSKQSTRAYIGITAQGKLICTLPTSIEEQHRVVNILSTVDEKIEVIDEQIEQTRELKKGLMHRLFTKGIYHTIFKDSPLGQIPENWQFDKVGNLTKTYAGGTPKRNVNGYYGGIIPWVKSGEVNQRNITATEESVTEKAIKESSAKLIKSGAILVALYGATAGNVGRLRINACSNQAVLAVNSKHDKLTNDFIYHFLKQTAPNLIKLTQGSGQPNLSKGIIDSVYVPLPPTQEQEKIADILTTVDNKLDVLQEKKKQYQELKKGLMQQLLTGKLRVNHLIEKPEMA